MSDLQRTIFLLRIPQNNNKKEDVMATFLSQIAEILKGEKITLSLEIAIYGKYLWFFLTCPTLYKNEIKGQWYSQYPQTEVEEIKDPFKKILSIENTAFFIGSELYYSNSEYLPIQTYKELEKNPLISLSGLVNSFTATDIGIMQLVIQPPEKDNLWNTYWKNKRKTTRAKNAELHKEKPLYITLEEEKEAISYFKTTIRFLMASQNKEKLRVNLASMLVVYTKNLERQGIQKLREHKVNNNKAFLDNLKNRQLGNKQIRASTDEIATFFHLPYSEEEISQIAQVRSKRASPPQNLPTESDISLFGKTNFQNQQTSFGIKNSDRRRHLYVIGKTGMGKSKLLELLINKDIRSNKGIILMEPHGDLSKEIVNMIPESRIDDVVYFDPTDLDYPIGFNPMEGVGSIEFRQNIVAGFISIFKKMFGLNWNERFEHVLRYTTLALLEYPQASILGIPRMLTDNIFRQEVIGYVTDPMVKKFWATEFSSWNDQFANDAIVPIINKIGQFVANPMIRNIVGQAKSGFSLDEVMNKGKILIVNLSVGKLGEENAALLGSMFITKIWQTAMSRTSIPEEKRLDTFLYIDEFQNFATTAFANILSEARKYRLNLTIAHQYMQQLPPEVRATIFGNVGSIIGFRVGGEDAQVLVKEFEPVFNINDFLNLDLRNFYIKMAISGQTASPFSAQTLTLNVPKSNQISKIVELTRKKYAKSRDVVEKELELWEKGNLQKAVNTKPTTEEFYPEPIV
jgi:hypothetical protein